MQNSWCLYVWSRDRLDDGIIKHLFLYAPHTEKANCSKHDRPKNILCDAEKNGIKASYYIVVVLNG